MEQRSRQNSNRPPSGRQTVVPLRSAASGRGALDPGEAGMQPVGEALDRPVLARPAPPRSGRWPRVSSPISRRSTRPGHSPRSGRPPARPAGQQPVADVAARRRLARNPSRLPHRAGTPSGRNPGRSRGRNPACRASHAMASPVAGVLTGPARTPIRPRDGAGVNPDRSPRRAAAGASRPVSERQTQRPAVDRDRRAGDEARPLEARKTIRAAAPPARRSARPGCWRR